jgi:hypothetical protein
MVFWSPVDVPQSVSSQMELAEPGQCHVDDKVVSHDVLATAHPAEDDEEEEEDENLFAGADDRSVATVLDYFAEYSAEKERHDSGISGSPVSISDSEQLHQEGAFVDTAPTLAETAQASVKDAVKDVRVGAKDAAVTGPTRAGRYGGESAPPKSRSRSSSSIRQADQQSRLEFYITIFIAQYIYYRLVIARSNRSYS